MKATQQHIFFNASKEAIKLLLMVSLILVNLVLFAQSNDEKLALQYAKDGDCEKANLLFEGLVDKKIASTAMYAPYLACLDKSKSYKQAIKVCKFYGSRYNNIYFKVDEAHYYKLNGEKKKYTKLNQKLIISESTSQFKASALSLAFRNRFNFDAAVEVLELNQNHQLEPYLHVTSIAQIYFLKDEKQKAIDLLLDYSVSGDMPYRQVLSSLPMFMNSAEDYSLLKQSLIKRIRTAKFPIIYEEMLSWVFVQQKDWNSAFVHYKSISKKKNDQGRTVLNLARMCTSNAEHEVAAKCYAFIMSLGANNRYYHQAQAGWLSSRYESVISIPYPDSASLSFLESDFLNYIGLNKNNPYAANAMKQLAEIYITQLGKPKKAIELLEKVIKVPSTSEKFKAECKLDLGDAYLYTGDVWESELLYAQVDKAYKEDALGQEAKFKKARLAYFRGEFGWAEKQLEVLKGATSQLISNNAIELALRILDNIGLDSNYVAMEAYSNAELLLFQNKYQEAMKEADKISLVFPEHSLVDDVHYLKARVYSKIKNWDNAIIEYKYLIAQHKEDILYDNALFELASIYESQFKDTLEAMNYYEKLILEQKGSLYVVEASKRYRALRGDVIKREENYYFEP